MHEDKRSAIWGGGTIGLILGSIISIFNGQFTKTVIIAILIGIVLGIIAELLGKFYDRKKLKRGKETGL